MFVISLSEKHNIFSSIYKTALRICFEKHCKVQENKWRQDRRYTLLYTTQQTKEFEVSRNSSNFKIFDFFVIWEIEKAACYISFILYKRLTTHSNRLSSSYSYWQLRSVKIDLRWQQCVQLKSIYFISNLKVTM